MERVRMTCDICGGKIPLDREVKCPTCELVRCNNCIDTCKECGEPLCCNSGMFNPDLCKACESKYYLDEIEERLCR